MNIGVIGAGKWGQALIHAISIKHTLKVYSRQTRDIPGFCSLDEVLQCDFIIVSIATQHIATFLKHNFKYNGQKILIASKGIDAKQNKFLFEIFEKYVPVKNLCYLSGPSFAEEVMKDLPTALVISSHNKKLAYKFMSMFPRTVKMYYGKDVIGAEVCGAYKNVLAIAAGVSDGMALGNNARASLVARGLVEMYRFGKKFGAKKSTFFDLSGAGDLFLTASSPMSRNYRVGYGLANGKDLKDILEEMGEVAEGIMTSKAIHHLSKNFKIYTPIAFEVSKLLDGQTTKQTVENLLRSKKIKNNL